MKWIFLVLTACTTFDPIAGGVCGNGLLEPGEDCDSNDASCVACQVVCAKASECPTAAYTCGVDGFCHAPSGVLASPTPASSLLADDVFISDIDRDGIGDVLALSKTSVAVRFGDPRAALTSAFSTATPGQTATAAVADLDGDGTLDVAIAAADGLVEYASPFGTPSPQISRIPLVGDDGAPFSSEGMWPMGGNAVGALLASANDHMELAVLNFGTGVSLQGGALCDGERLTTDFVTTDLDVYAASATDVVVSVPTGSGSSRQACVMAIHLAADGTATFFDITPSGPAPARRVVFADLDFDTDPCPSLVDSDGGGPALKAWDGSLAGGHCTLASTASALPVADTDPATVAVGRIPLTPAIAFAASDALVLSTGIDVMVFGAPSTLQQVYTSERRLAAVASGDLDGDGRIDAVLSGVGEDDLDVVYRVVSGFFPGFIVARLDTAGVVTAMTIGDFDGNGLNDIAYSEHLLDHDRLSVAYDTPGRTQTTVVQGTLDQAISLVPFQIPDSTDPVAVVGDLIVLDRQAGTPTPQALSLLQGSPDRTMLAYFDPRTGADPLKTSYRGVVAGHFTTGSSAQLDLLALAPATASSAQMYRLDGTSVGLDPDDPLDLAGGVQIPGLALCAGQPLAIPCLDDAVLLAWPTGAAHDVVIGIDQASPPRAFALDPWAAAPTMTAAPLLTASVPAGATIHSLRAIDLDGDGAPELVATFTGGTGLVLACSVGATGVPTACTDLGAVAATALTGATCSDASFGHVAPADPTTPIAIGTDLIALCHDATGAGALVRIADTAGTFTATVLATGLGDLRVLALGDVTGDGIDDVVALQGDSGSRSMTVLVQCSSHDLACQAAGVAP